MSSSIRLKFALIGVSILAILVFPWLLLKGEKPSYNLPIQVIQAKKNSSVLYQSAGSLPYSASFGNKKEPAHAPTKLEVSNSSITTIPEAEIKEIKKEGENKITIIALDGTKFIQTLQKTGIKEEIIIQEPVLEIGFKMNLEGLTTRKAAGLWRFFDQTEQELFYIPKPFMVDKKGVKSEDVEIIIENAIIKIIPDTVWLADPNRVYPVIIDPSFILNILNVHSHPQAGDNWIVSFETIGTADLTITPDDQATIDDIDFVSLKCGSKEKTPQILAGDVIFYPDWSCGTTGEITHLVNIAAPHVLKFQFGDQIKYAYNNPDAVGDSYTDETKIASSENIDVDTGAGQVKLEQICYSEASPQTTGWGDNLYGCSGSTERCYNGTCVTCGGWVYDDGCSGCAGQGGDGCWYNEVSSGASCTTTCSNGCVAANWNDSTSCTVGSHFGYSCSTCNAQTSSWAPGWYGGVANVCMYRSGIGQSCSTTPNYNRWCVCNY